LRSSTPSSLIRRQSLHARSSTQVKRSVNRCGFSHQDPGFIDHIVNKKAEIIRVYLPPDANTLLSVMDHCLRSRDYVNVVVAGKQPTLDWLPMDDAILHCTRGIGTWDWASSDAGAEPDVVLGCAGDVPTLEVLAAAALLREHLPELKVRVVNVVDLMRLQDSDEHPHGLSDHEFDALFTPDRPVIFAYHGYPWLIHRLTGGLTHATDFSNASRTGLLNLQRLRWDTELLDIFGLPLAAMPEPLPRCHRAHFQIGVQGDRCGI
jgi:phosphoketolase